MTICEACFLDRAGATSHASYFQPKTPTEKTTTCSMSSLPLLVTCLSLLEKEFDRWVKMAQYITSQLECKTLVSTHTTTAVQWYNLVDPATQQPLPNFDICPSYYAAFGLSMGLEGLFARAQPVVTGQSRYCDLSTLQPRRQAYLRKYLHTMFTHDPQPLVHYVRRYALLEQCAGVKNVTDRRWYGMDAFFRCPSCYEDVVRGTSLASMFKYQNELFSEGKHCYLYTRRMRQKYLDACSRGDLAEFEDVCRHREFVYQQTVPTMEHLLAITKMRAKEANNTAYLGASYTSMDSMARTTNHVYLYGGHSYNTPYGATAGAYNAQYANLSSPDTGALFQMMELERQWKEVE